MGWTKVGNTNDQETKVRYGKTYKKVGNIKDVQPSQTAKKGWVKVGNVKGAQPAPIVPVAPKMPTQQPEMSTATKIDQGLRKFSQAAANTPKFTFADKIKNPVGRFLAGAAQDLANTPSNFVRGAFGTYGQEITPSNLLKGAGQAANVGLNVASLPGVGSVVKQGINQGLKQGAIQGVKSGAGYGAAYGASSGIQEGDTVGEQTKNALKQALLGSVVGGGLGGALGAGGAAFSNRSASRLAPLPRKSPLPETQGASQLKPLPSRTAPLESAPRTKFQKSVPYTEGIKPLPEKVNRTVGLDGLESKKLEFQSLVNKLETEKARVNKLDPNRQITSMGDNLLDAKDYNRMQELAGEISRLEDSNRGIHSTADIKEIVKLKRSLRGAGIQFNEKASKQELASLLNGKSDSPLLQEARKYKSAEEFVKSQGDTVYRGGIPYDKKLFNSGQLRGLSVTRDIDTADSFSRPGKPANIYQGGVISNGEKGVIEEIVLPKNTKMLSVLDAPKELRDIFNKENRHVGIEEISKWAEKNGYDAVDFKDFEIRILNPDIIKTKSQLTDLWKEAQREDIPKVIEKIKNITKPTGKERGFIESVRNSPEISQDLASRVEGTYDPKRNKVLQEQSQRLIFDNITEAERIAKNDVGAEGGIMNTELIKHYDSIAQQAKQSGDMETFNRAMDKAVEVAQSRAANLTETAQNLQAASTISKLSPDGLLHYITKVSKDIGAPAKLSNEATYDFMRRAGEIQNILDPREKAFKTFDLIDDLAEAMPKGQSDKLLNALNLPRAIMSTGDLSAPLRQGIFTAARNPITFGKNFGKMFKYAFSEDAYRGLKADIITSPNYDLYVKHKLPLTDISAGLTGREEAFMSNLAEKIPVFGKLAKGSNRAYTGFLNKMRVDLFDDFVNTAKLNGIKDQKYFDDAARFVGAATGRGNLVKTLEGSAPALNSIFFSPRLMASRISLINPAFYMKLEPTVRKEALKSLGAFVGTGMSILALAKANGAEVSSDPRSADFGKMKFGNTRYDIWGGFQQYARLIGQLATGEKVSTITGKETTLGQGYNAPTRESIFLDFLKSKEAPIMSLLTRAAQGEKYGEQFNLPVELVDRFLPMVTSDAFDLYKEYGPKGVAGAVPGFFGVGSQTYGDQIPTMGTTEANNPTIEWRTQPGLGETILNSVTGKEVSTLPKDQWKALYEERKQEQIRQAEVDKVKQIVLISGEPQYVGDTKVYLENGVVKTKKEGKGKRLPLKDQLLYDEIQKRKSGQPFYK